MNKIVIDGKEIQCEGDSIKISNGKVVVDKKIVSTYAGAAEVKVYGDVENLESDGAVSVHGNVKSMDCGGSCHILGNVLGDIDAGGSVTCKGVLGSIDAGGSVVCS